MRWSTFRTPDGAQGVGVWRADELFPVPGARRLVDLFDSLQAAGDEAVRHSTAVDPATVELLAPVPEPPAIRDFMAFEEHVVTASAAIGLTVDPLWYRQPSSTSPTRPPSSARTPTSRSRRGARRSTTSSRWQP